MRRREYYWSLFHTPEKNQLDDLKTDQVEAIFAAIPNAQRSEWLIWRDGFAGWKPFTEFPELLIGLRNTAAAIAAPPPVPVGFKQKEPIAQIDVNSEILAGSDDLALIEHADTEGRIQPRYQKKFDLKIQLVDRILKTQTTDVSLNGMRIKDMVPVNTPRYIPVELRYGPKTVSLLCSAVRGKQGGPTNRLKIEVNENPELLFSLLLEG